MKLLIPLSVLLAVCHGVSIYDIIITEWGTFKLQYKKNYTSSEEEAFRLKVFRENRYKIAKHNAAYARGQVSFELGINQFGDMLSHEVADMMNGLRYDKSAPRNGSTHLRPANVVIPKEIDWRDHGYVTEVKDQGHCGSCWAFSSTGSLEGQHFRATGKLVSLSEQNLIDCSGKEGNEGCNGGVMEYAFDYVELNKGIDTEVSYPYKSGHGKTFPCKFNPKSVGATDTGFTDIPAGDENALLEAVATIGPISVGIDANHASFHLYQSGVYYEPECDSMNVDHAVLVVGYGTTEDGQDYWLVKNSWDTTWGDNGYIKMARNRDNNCGIASYAVYPLV